MTIDLNYFRASVKVPPGVAVVTKGDVIIYFGSLFALTDEMQKNRIPSESIIHLNTRDYRTISDRMKQIVPEAPSVEAQNREFSDWHEHPTLGWKFRVTMDEDDPDRWIWRRQARVTTAHLPIDETRYPTAEGAYRAAIGD